MPKMVDHGRSDFCADFTMTLCALELKQALAGFAISSHTALKLAIQALRSYLKLPCEYEFHIIPNTKVSTARDHEEH